MAMLSSMGTHSCATMGIGGISCKRGDINSYEENEEYRSDPENYELYDWSRMKKRGQCEALRFFNYHIYPHGALPSESRDYPFDMLMDIIDREDQLTKFYIATINKYQFYDRDFYWPRRFIARGFNLYKKIKNKSGTNNYIFIRDGDVELKQSDTDKRAMKQILKEIEKEKEEN